ncbi:hypothetical protein PG996_002216 [Apiospora saccharicola]|uniref:Protein kinase domain-containing protein n=1 Tax=Apiospora saccharicola TaxID=335842 RepID=A0ABR1WLT5_9PEZI
MTSFSETIDDINTSSGGSSLDQNRATNRLLEVKRYFTNEGLQFRKVIAQGNHGGAVLFDQWLPVEPEPEPVPAPKYQDDMSVSSSSKRKAPSEPTPTPTPEPTMQRRQLVVKYALDTEEDATSDNDEDLRNEFRWLRKFAGAEHIIQVLPEYNHLWRTKKNQSSDGGPLLAHPVIVMEYLENGTLDQLINRFGKIERRIPQRLIWSFALCMLRAVAAITYPDQLDGRRRREVAKDDPPSLITQNSWKGLNVLIGDMMEDDAEHSLAPVLKLIDFGRGREEDPEADPYWEELKGLSNNLAGVGWVLQDLVDRDLYRENDYRVWRAGRSAVFDPYDFTTGAHALVLANERLDRALRDLIAMCLAGHRHHLPTLRELLTLARAGRRKTAEDLRPLYAKKKKKRDDAQAQAKAQAQSQGGNEEEEEEEWLYETDEAIEELMQRIVFDADFDPDSVSDMALDEVGVAVTASFLNALTINK